MAGRQWRLPAIEPFSRRDLETMVTRAANRRKVIRVILGVEVTTKVPSGNDMVNSKFTLSLLLLATNARIVVAPTNTISKSLPIGS